METTQQVEGFFKIIVDTIYSVYCEHTNEILLDECVKISYKEMFAYLSVENPMIKKQQI